MDAEKLKAMLEDAVELGKKQREENTKLQAKLDQLSTDFEAMKAANDGVVTAEMLDELKSQFSDLETKMKRPVDVVPEDAKKAMKEMASKSIGAWLKGKDNGTAADMFKFVQTDCADQFKTLNITNPDEGGRAVAEILSRDVIEYAREYSPILNYVGRKSEMTRNFRELVLVTYPSTQAGIENVAGVDIAETTTQEYKEVKSKEFKVNAKPRITDEAMYGADIDLYGQLIRLLGREISIYLAQQVLYGNGSDKNARGVLSSNRLDITNLTGESFKPTLAADPANARNADFFPAKATGVSGGLGATDKAIVDLMIDVVNEMPTEHLNGSVWYMNRKTKGLLEKVRDAEERPIFRSSYMDNGGARLMCNGYPVVIDDTMPDVAADSAPIIFGRLDHAFAINDGDIDKMLLDPYTVDGCTVVKYDKEMFEMVQQSDAIIIVAATTNGPA